LGQGEGAAVAQGARSKPDREARLSVRRSDHYRRLFRGPVRCARGGGPLRLRGLSERQAVDGKHEAAQELEEGERGHRRLRRHAQGREAGDDLTAIRSRCRHVEASRAAIAEAEKGKRETWLPLRGRSSTSCCSVPPTTGGSCRIRRSSATYG